MYVFFFCFDRITQILEVKNSNTTDYEPSPSHSELSEPAPAAVDSLPNPATPTQKPMPRQQSSPANFHVEPNQSEVATTVTQDDTEEAAVSSTTTSKEDQIFRNCIMELKDTPAAKEWKYIARRLGMADLDIDQIQHKHGSELKEAFYQMIRKWRETEGKHATYDALIMALKAEKLNAVVEIVKKYQQQ